MPHKTSELKKILENGKIDTSDFILIALDILKNESKGLESKEPLNQAMDEIKVDYLEIHYSDAIKKLISAAKNLKDPSIAELFEKIAPKAAKNSKPEEVISRRYFENNFVNTQWKTLNTAKHQNSLDRFAKFMVGANKLYAEKEQFATLKKVNNLEDMEMVIAAMRGFGEKTESIINQESAMRHEDKEPLSALKDRGAKRKPEDVGYSQNPGIIKANSPTPIDERRDVAVKGSITDSFAIDRKVKGGYSARNVDVPFVNSVSGTAYTLAAVLDQYIQDQQDILTHSTLQEDMDNIVQAFVAFTCKSGFHSLSEMVDVLSSQEVTEVFDKHALTVNNPFSKETLDSSIAAATINTETRQFQKSVQQALSQHSLFKRHAEPTKSTSFPSEIALRVRENKLTGPRVENALKEMYQEGLAGNEKYSPEKCREIAQQFINYAKHHHRNFNMDGVNKFLKEIDLVIEEQIATTENRIEHR